MRHSALPLATTLLLCLSARSNADEPKRHPAPNAADQLKAEKLVKELFKAEYAKQTAGDKLALATKLLEQARETADDPAARYVLLREASDLAAQAGDVWFPLLVIGELAQAYSIEAVPRKADVLEHTAKAVRGPEANQELAVACPGVAKDGVEEDQYDVALRLLSLAEDAARKAQSVPLFAQAKARRVEAEEVKKAHAVVLPFLVLLEAKPNDPKANWLILQQLAGFRDGAIIDAAGLMD